MLLLFLHIYLLQFRKYQRNNIRFKNFVTQCKHYCDYNLHINLYKTQNLQNLHVFHIWLYGVGKKVFYYHLVIIG